VNLDAYISGLIKQGKSDDQILDVFERMGKPVDPADVQRHRQTSDSTKKVTTKELDKVTAISSSYDIPVIKPDDIESHVGVCQTNIAQALTTLTVMLNQDIERAAKGEGELPRELTRAVGDVFRVADKLLGLSQMISKDVAYKTIERDGGIAFRGAALEMVEFKKLFDEYQKGNLEIVARTVDVKQLED
jgi:hypothetical protein